MKRFINWLLTENATQTSAKTSLSSVPVLIQNLREISTKAHSEKYQRIHQEAKESRERLVESVKKRALEVANEGYGGFWMNIHEYRDGYDFTPEALTAIRSLGFKVTRGPEYGTTSYNIHW